MRLNSKVTWGLAWTGLAVVLAVPSADFLTGRLNSGAAAVLTSDVEPVKTASIAPADPLPVKTVTTIKTKNGISIVPAGSKPPVADPVDRMLSNGKPLPNYISADKPAATDTQVASIDPTPPTPFPAWARPKVASTPAAPALTSPAATPEPVVIVDDTTLTGSIASPTAPTPPAIVDDSANWDTETLRAYLERRGILEGGDEQSSATVTERSTTYDPDGFYLNQGPNSDRMTREERRKRIERMLRESGDDPESFTLF
jgi:hypothetical protein